MPYVGKKPADIIATSVDTDTGAFSGNVTAGGTLGVTGETTLATHLNLGDGDIIKLGASADLTIQHDGSNSFVNEGGTGHLFIGGSQVNLMNAANNEYLIQAIADGAVNIYHNNVAKFATTSTGVAITGGFTATDGCTITTADNTPQLKLISTDADANAGPILELKRDSSSPAADDFLGNVDFIGENNASEEVVYGEIIGRIEDVTDGAEDGRLTLKTMRAGSSRSAIDCRIDAIIVNDDSDDVDFRVESNGNANMLFVDGGNDAVGIGNNNPNDFGTNTSDLVVGTTSGEHGMTIASGTANSGRIQFADNTSSPFRGAIEYAHGSSDALHFYTAGSQRMSIQSNGRVNIGVSNSTDTGFRFFSPSGQSSKVAEFARNDGTGCHLPVGSTAFTASSDETLKENITEFNKQTSYDDIKKMRAVTFNYKDWTLDGINYQDDKKRIGFIAQDWETNYPEIIDKDQNDKLCMKYTETIPVLLSALQKAQEKIEAMEARITTLEGA